MVPAKERSVNAVKQIPCTAPNEYYAEHDSKSRGEISDTAVTMTDHTYSIPQKKTPPLGGRRLLFSEHIVTGNTSDLVGFFVAHLHIVG